jgi:preprotein translocase subunit YajC
MVQWFVLSLFLYFPEDKREYIPAGITFAIFFIMALIAMRFFIVISRKEAKKAKELEDKIMKKDTGRNS